MLKQQRQSNSNNQVIWDTCRLYSSQGRAVESSSFVSMIFDSSAGLWMDIQSAGDVVFQTSNVRILHSGKEHNLPLFDSKSLPCTRALSKSNNKYACRHATGEPFRQWRQVGWLLTHHRDGLLCTSGFFIAWSPIAKVGIMHSATCLLSIRNIFPVPEHYQNQTTNTHKCPSFRSSWVNRPMKVWYRWVITFHCFKWW